MAISRKRAFGWAAVLLLLALVVPPLIPLTRFRLRIPAVVSGALGRQVTVSRVSLRLLPQPGFDLQNLAISEDPNFGAEPVLTAPEVTAALRLTSLWRGRLEIGSLRLKDASFNLVRRPDGAWNIQSLMMRAAKTPIAPTAKARPEARPRFPYIEVTSGRLNFKSGVEKKVVALTDADFALWLASENEWRARLEARPMRTDANLSDAGRIEAEASVQRATGGGEPHLNIQARLRDAQLGQLSALIYGRDRGWRGGTSAEVTLSGPPAALNFGVHAAVEDFHRYDITPADSLRLDAICAGALSVRAETISNLNCTTPASRGVIAVRGTIGQLLHQRQYDLQILLKQFPVHRAMSLLRRAKRDLPEDLAATGALNAEFSVRSQGDQRSWTGAGKLIDLALRSGSDAALAIGDVAFTVGRPGYVRKFPTTDIATIDPGFRLDIQPATVSLGGVRPAVAAASVGPRGYDVQISGPASVERLLTAARLLGMRAPSYRVTGSADLQLRISGQWAGFAAPVVTGRAQLLQVEAKTAALPVPVRISSARLALTDRDVQLQNLTASLSQTGPRFTGWVALPRGCARAEQCEATFALRADVLDTDELNRVFNPRLHGRPWYMLWQTSANRPSLLRRLRAQGELRADRLVLKSVLATGVVAQVTANSGRLLMSNITANLLGGHHHGEWLADFTPEQPIFSGSGRVDRLSLTQVSAAMQDPWASGTADVSYRMQFSGESAKSMLNSATAEADFIWNNGLLNHLMLASDGTDVPQAMRFARFRGHASLKNGLITLEQSKIETSGGIYQVSGTASVKRALSLKLALGTARRYSVEGTLEAPRVLADVADTPRTAPSPTGETVAPTPAPPRSGPGVTQ